MSLPVLSPWRLGGSHYPEAWHFHYGVELTDVMMLATTSAYRDCKKYSVTISAVFKGKHAQRALSCNSYWVSNTSDYCPARSQLVFLFPLSVQFNCSVVSDSLRPHGQQHARPPCLSPTPRVYPNSCLLSRWCHPTILSSVVPVSSCPQSFPASGSFQVSQFFASGGQSIEVSASASVLPTNIQDWFPLGRTCWISLGI